MGYYLEVKTSDGAEYLGTKLYGYSEDDYEFRSVQFLKHIGKIGADEIGYGYCPEITLTNEEFREWAELYIEDSREFWPNGDSSWEDELRKYADIPGDVVLSWF